MFESLLCSRNGSANLLVTSLCFEWADMMDVIKESSSPNQQGTGGSAPSRSPQRFSQSPPRSLSPTSPSRSLGPSRADPNHPLYSGRRSASPPRQSSSVAFKRRSSPSGRGTGIDDERSFRRDRVILLQKMTKTLGRSHSTKTGQTHSSIYISIAEEQANQRKKKYGFKQFVRDLASLYLIKKALNMMRRLRNLISSLMLLDVDLLLTLGRPDPKVP